MTRRQQLPRRKLWMRWDDSVQKLALTAAAVSVTMAGVLTLARSALAAGPAHWESTPRLVHIHSTRVAIETTLFSEGLATKWSAQYAPAEPGGSAPPGNSKVWKPVNEAEISLASSEGNSTNFVSIGHKDANEEFGTPIVLRFLTPGTSYYARFQAENEDNSVPSVLLVPFTTLAEAAPEVPLGGATEEETSIFRFKEEITDTSATMEAKIETNGGQAEYTFEYAPAVEGRPPSAGWAPFTAGASGEITVAEDYKVVQARLSGLKPDTEYCVRIRLHNEVGLVFQTRYNSGGPQEQECFITGIKMPAVGVPEVRNNTATSAHLSATLSPHRDRTLWWFESSAPASGMWVPIAGAEGEVSQERVEELSYAGGVLVGADFTGLSTSSGYEVRLVAENVCAEGHEGCGKTTGRPTSFETAGAPSVVSLNIHELVSEGLRLLGGVNPKSSLTSAEQAITVKEATSGSFTLSFGGNRTGPIGYRASASEVAAALQGIGASVGVEGLAGGPYRLWFLGTAAGMAEPTIEANGEGLSAGGSVEVFAMQRGGEAYRTEYEFQYVSDKNFRESQEKGEDGWTNPQKTIPVQLSAGSVTQLVGRVVDTLLSGERYHYRLVAHSSIPAIELGGDESLIAPSAPVASGGETTCPNATLRTGLSASLPDCRGYEQVTPREKQGAQEPFKYRAAIDAAAVVGEDGEHAALEAPAVSYGGMGSNVGQSPYLFSRGRDGGWSMTAGAPQPQTGIANLSPQLYSADATRIAFESGYSPSRLSQSPEIEYKIGPFGGPYTTVASIPRADVEGSGWAAANGDLSELVLSSTDRTLLGGPPTGTKQGSDLYEYSSANGLRQVNVIETGGRTATIGSCGARMVYGEEEPEGKHRVSSPHSVSADGLRVFFEAVPSTNCSQARHLYMRVNGSETVDVGSYRFLAADALGRQLLLENESGGRIGYDTAAATFETEPSETATEEQELSLAGIPVQRAPSEDDAFARPRYAYWKPRDVGTHDEQVYRYDRERHEFECISCASPFNATPKFESFLQDVQGLPDVNGGLPDYTAVSGNGNFAFFTTIAELVPGDVDGEIPPEYLPSNGEFVNVGGHLSPSTDVYEWRAPGVDGCMQVRGCLALISDGRGGYLTLLLGGAQEGRDVFFYTRSNLVPADHGDEGSLGEGNVYDARIDGGSAPPAPPAPPCEGNECSTPPSPPTDITPGSFTFSGNGNVSEEPTNAKRSKKAVTKKRRKTRGHRRGRRRAKKHAARGVRPGGRPR